MTALGRREAYDRGRDAESFVADHLGALGWVVLARNWRAEGGEIDLVVQRDGVVRFVEVKARTGTEDDLPGLEAVSRAKRRRLRAAAEAWLAEHGPPEREVAFLVALVSSDAASWSVELWDDPF